MRPPSEKGAWLLFFLGVAATAFGSSWYHWAPSNDTLLWDRLPMTLGFMGFFAGIVGERISERAYRLLLWPLLGIGVASVLYWYATERQGHGDLRLYGLVQFFPLLLIPLIMALYRPRYSHSRYIFFALAWYAAAKGLEYWDRAIYTATSGLVGGHASNTSPPPWVAGCCSGRSVSASRSDDFPGKYAAVEKCRPTFPPGLLPWRIAGCHRKKSRDLKLCLLTLRFGWLPWEKLPCRGALSAAVGECRLTILRGTLP